jgi:hypothetical protein
MSERRRNEKEEEKRGEKEEEKRGGWDEKWRRGRGNAVQWAAILIWGALVLLADTSDFAANFSWWEGWAVFLAGVGAIVLLGTVIRLLMPEHRRRVVGSLIIGFNFLGVGLGGLISWNYIWVVVLIAIALVILLSAFARRR